MKFCAKMQRIAKLLQTIALIPIAVCTAFSASFVWGEETEKPEGKIRIGVLAKRGNRQCFEQWGPTADYLARQIPGHSFSIVPLDFDEIHRAVEQREVEFFLVNSSFYIDMEIRFGARRIATLNNLYLDGMAHNVFAGVIFARADRMDIQSVPDLEGKRLMAVDERSLGGWHMAWRELKEHGIDPHSDFGDLCFGGTHDAVVYAVRDGKVDAGSVRSNILERMALEGKIRLDDFRLIMSHKNCDGNVRFLHSTKHYPEWPFVKSLHTDDELAELVAVALIKMSADDPAARSAKCAGWTIPQNYQPVRECLMALQLPPYEDYGKISLPDFFRQYRLWLLGIFLLVALIALILIHATRLKTRLEQSMLAKEERERARAFLQTVIDGFPDAFMVINREYKITLANRTARETAETAKNTDPVANNMTCHQLIYNSDVPCDSDQFPCPVKHVLETKAPVVMEHIVDGDQPMAVEITAAPIFDKQGEIVQIVESRRDISERRRAEELQRAKDSAEAANQAKSVFLANMSHELRSPLNAILGFSSLMSDIPNLEPDHRENLDIIRQSGEHLLNLINDVLDMSKIEAGRTTLNEKIFDLHRMLDDLEDMLRMRAEDKGLQLLFEKNSGVPRYIRTDEVKLRQVLINLLSNGIKFTEEGEVRLTVGSEPRENPDSETRLNFEVTDTGPGIAPGEMDSLFEAFAQTETGRQSLEGTGLGLPISRKFVQLMGGDISAAGEVGRGAVFRFHISVFHADPSDISHSRNRHAIALEPGQPRYRILITDDRADNRKLMVKLLNPFGFELREAENGREALEIWEEWKPHLVWMDMQMPVMNGYEASGKIKESAEQEDTAVIALTASVYEEERAMVLSAGCDDFLRKPFRESNIFELMTKHIGVRFVYEEEHEPDENASESDAKPLTEKALAALPAVLTEELKIASESGDADRLYHAIEVIRSHDAALCDALMALADEFEFDKILDLVSAGK